MLFKIKALPIEAVEEGEWHNYWTLISRVGQLTKLPQSFSDLWQEGIKISENFWKYGANSFQLPGGLTHLTLGHQNDDYYLEAVLNTKCEVVSFSKTSYPKRVGPVIRNCEGKALQIKVIDEGDLFKYEERHEDGLAPLLTIG